MPYLMIIAACFGLITGIALGATLSKGEKGWAAFVGLMVVIGMIGFAGAVWDLDRLERRASPGYQAGRK